MDKEKSQNQSTEDSKPKVAKGKKLEDYSGEELDQMTAEESGKLYAESIVESLNDPANHDKSN